jgi:hypothetical protein
MLDLQYQQAYDSLDAVHGYLLNFRYPMLKKLF